MSINSKKFFKLTSLFTEEKLIERKYDIFEDRNCNRSNQVFNGQYGSTQHVTVHILKKFVKTNQRSITGIEVMKCA